MQEARQMTAERAEWQHTSNRKYNVTKEHLFLCASVGNYRRQTERAAFVSRSRAVAFTLTGEQFTTQLGHVMKRAVALMSGM